MKESGTDFGNGNKVFYWSYDHIDGTEYGVIVERDYETYEETEFEGDFLATKAEYNHQLKIMKNFLRSTK